MNRLKDRINVFMKYRHLLQELVSKDIKLKYRRSFLGYLWSILNPLLTMIVMVIVFSNMFRFDIENYPQIIIEKAAIDEIVTMLSGGDEQC